MTEFIRNSRLMLATWAAAFLAIPATLAQSPTFEWANLLVAEAPPYDAIDTQVDGDGNVLAAYRAWDNNATSITTSLTWSDNVVLKLDSAGNLIWKLAVLPNIRRLAVDSSGNTYVAGSLLRGHPDNPVMSASYFVRRGISVTGTGTAYVARISPAGQLEWVRLDGGTAVADANAVAVAADGSYFVARIYTKTAATFGSTPLPTPVTTKARNVFVVKYAANGTAQWVRVGQTPDQNTFQGQLALGPANSLVLGWNAAELTFGEAGEAITGAQLVRFNADGQCLGTRRVEGYATSLAVDPQGHALVASDPLVLTRFNPDGEQLWQRRAEVVSDSFRYQGLAVDARGDCYATGYFMSRYVDGRVLPGRVSFDSNTAETTALFELFVVK